MKIPKLQTALKKAEAVQRSTQAVLQKVVDRARATQQKLADGKTAYKAARKELKRLRQESAMSRTAQEVARDCLKKSASLVEKLAKKLKKAEKKIAPRGTARKPSPKVKTGTKVKAVRRTRKPVSPATTTMAASSENGPKTVTPLVAMEAAGA